MGESHSPCMKCVGSLLLLAAFSRMEKSVHLKQIEEEWGRETVLAHRLNCLLCRTQELLRTSFSEGKMFEHTKEIGLLINHRNAETLTGNKQLTVRMTHNGPPIPAPPLSGPASYSSFALLCWSWHGSAVHVLKSCCNCLFAYSAISPALSTVEVAPGCRLFCRYL